jgi:hypothetical protein
MKTKYYQWGVRFPGMEDACIFYALCDEGVFVYDPDKKGECWHKEEGSDPKTWISTQKALCCKYDSIFFQKTNPLTLLVAWGIPKIKEHKDE